MFILFIYGVTLLMWMTQTLLFLTSLHHQESIPMGTVNIAGLDKADLLMRAFNASKQQDMSMMDQRGRQDMTIKQAREIANQGPMNYDYLYGRVLKIDLTHDDVGTWAYNRDVGPGAFEKIVADMRAGKSAPPAVTNREPVDFDVEKFDRENPIEILAIRV